MKQKPVLLMLLVIFSLACGRIPLGAPTPTSSPEPTSTPLPTNTPTPIPTATLDIAATKAAENAAEAEKLKAELEDFVGDADVPYEDGFLAWKEDEPIVVSLDGPDGILTDIDDSLNVSNFILKSDVRWDATGIIICGIVFRSEDDVVNGKQYVFSFLRLSGLPAWAIEVNEFGYYQNSPTGTKFSGAINQNNGATNEIVLVVNEDNFTVFINGIRQGRFFDYSKQRTDGKFAFFGTQDSGNGKCTFSNNWIWSIDPPDFQPNT